jgi:hypothetical protein
VALALCAAQAHADTVWLKNGDRLSGAIKLIDDGKLFIDTPYGGTITVKMDAVKTLESKEKVVVRQKAADEDYLATLAPAHADGHVLVNQGEHDADTPLPELEQVMAPRAVIRDLTFKGSLDMGLAYKSASTRTQDYHLGLNAQARSGNWRHTLTATYMREKEDQDTNTNNYSAQYAADRFITQKFFWEGRVVRKRDWVEDLSRQLQVGTGPGYQFWDDELGAFSLTGLLGHANYGYRNGNSAQFMATSLKWDYSRKLDDKRIELFTQGEIGRALSNKADFNLDLGVGARYKMTDWASLYVKYARNQVTGAEGNVNESTITTGVGATW